MWLTLKNVLGRAMLIKFLLNDEVTTDFFATFLMEVLSK